ncbi:DUF4919 domain-containing protein [Pyxidicoccus caerfyrddinensis]|uniref:DUF4919 domain-containing protein n=1 Tax=Pyxidicoccus caerfyrddinensis TaxID=2709663 RepID=UPI0013DD677A|nr:hypothetical protein [Pyxidicoccus caerfyrddinensis]
MLRKLLLAFALVCSGAHASPTSTPQGKLPIRPSVEKTEARYKELVARAKAGKAVNFRDLRLAWLYGPAMKDDPRTEKLPALRKAMFENMQQGGDVKVVLARARDILDIVYVDLDAQKAQRQSCEALGDDACAQAGRVVALGLLKSVVEGRDGRSCATAWRVVSVDEEYFVLRMIDAEFKQQRIVNEDGNLCDEMSVELDGEETKRYFEISDVVEARARRMKLKK